MPLATTDTPRKRALLIGINRYPLLQEHFHLRGCLNDVQIMAQLLRDQFGFPAEEMTLLCEEQATRDAILGALDGLLATSHLDDVVVIHFSGHGVRLPDEGGDESDAHDEAIVAQDCQLIRDDELFARIDRLGAAADCVTLVFDSCHSGSISRDGFGRRERWLHPRALGHVPALAPGEAAASTAHAGTRRPIDDRYVLVAACRDEQSAKELDLQRGTETVWHGALSYFLVQEVLRTPGNATYREVFERASALVSARMPDQHPQLEGTIDRVLFSTVEIEPLRFVHVLDRNGDRVSLQAGAVHGMTIGSRWAIYPSGTRSAAEAARIGIVRIDAVAAVSAEATIEEEGRAGAITGGARAVEHAHHFGEMRLLVSIAAEDGAPAADGLRRAVDASPLLRAAEAGEIGDLRIYLLPPRERVGRDDPVPGLAPITEPTWAVVNRSGVLAMPPCPSASTTALEVIVENLEAAARYRHTLAIRNPNPDSLLRGQIDVRLCRCDAGGQLTAVEAAGAGGQIVLAEGTACALEVTNRSAVPVYLGVVDFGLSGAVTLLYPRPKRAQEAVAPGKQVRIELGSVCIPADAQVDPIVGVAGPEVLKLFATAQATDFSAIAQKGFRRRGDGVAEIGDGAAAAPSIVGQLLDLAGTGVGERGPVPTRFPPAQDWTTVERAFFLSRG